MVYLQGAEGLKSAPMLCCMPQSSLQDVLSLLVAEHVHRLYVVDGAGRPVGIVTITDLLRVLVGWESSLMTQSTPVEEGEVQQIPKHFPQEVSEHHCEQVPVCAEQGILLQEGTTK